MSDKNGLLNLHLHARDSISLVAVHYIGYADSFVTIPLPPQIKLSPNDNTLPEIRVKAKNTVFTVTDGIFEIDAIASGLQDVPAVADILKFLPGLVSVGDRVVPLYGSPLYILNGIEQLSYDRIRALRPSQIKSVSVNYYPPAKYSSSVSCIISVNTVKGINDYLSAMFEHLSVIGRNYIGAGVIELMVQKKKWDGFISYENSRTKSHNRGINKYSIMSGDGEAERIVSSNSDEKSLRKAHRLMSNFSYRPNEKMELNIQNDLLINNGESSLSC